MSIQMKVMIWGYQMIDCQLGPFQLSRLLHPNMNPMWTRFFQSLIEFYPYSNGNNFFLIFRLFKQQIRSIRSFWTLRKGSDFVAKYFLPLMQIMYWEKELFMNITLQIIRFASLEIPSAQSWHTMRCVVAFVGHRVMEVLLKDTIITTSLENQITVFKWNHITFFQGWTLNFYILKTPGANQPVDSNEKSKAGEPRLEFEVLDFFAFGSPLGVLLAHRKIQVG